jgi:hypothetical protein
MSYSRGWVSKEVGAMMKTVLITGSIALVLALCGVLLTLFGPETPADHVLGHPDRVVLVRHGAERKERWERKPDRYRRRRGCSGTLSLERMSFL